MNNKYFKGLTILSFTFIILSGLYSCQKFLEPETPSLISNTTVYNNVFTAKMAVLGVYSDLSGDQGYGIRVSCYYPYDNDETMGPAKLGDNDRGDIAHYNATALNLQLYAPYVQMFEGIERANLCIYNIPKMTAFLSGNAEARRLYGESLTLRAQYYLELIRNWGDVPAQFLPSEVSNNLFISATNRDTIYNHLLNDLAIAESMVPWKSQISVVTGDKPDERITQGAIRALRARIALYRGGYDLRQNGSISRDPNYKAFYQIAWNECDTIIKSGEHTLNADYKALFKNYVCGHTLDPNNEIIFQVAMGGGGGATDSKLGTYDGPKWGGYLPSVTASTTLPVSPSYLTGSSSLLMLPTYFYLFDVNDVRRDVTIAPYNVMADYSKVGTKITALNDGKFRCDWVSNPGPSSSLYWGLNWPLIRYSDVLLMFAEADNEINNGPSTTAISAYEKVRLRGFGNNPAKMAAAGATPTDYSGFFQALVRERSLEFGGEGIRKYDLKRWGLLGTAIFQTQKNIASLLTNKYMSSTTYMAPPPAYTMAGASLPTSMYFNYPGSAGNPANQKSAVDDSTLWVNSFYSKSSSSLANTPTIALPLSNKSSWIGSGLTSTFGSYFGSGFKPNHSELFPIPQAVIDASGGALKQNNGY